MGEVVLSGEKVVVELEKVEEEEESGGGGGSKNGLMRWEKFLPKMILNVLLVEADDSTRQIIAALLRKCSYKVTAVPDGLKAWEMLKGRLHNFDLILTEVELPSISGYALLTLIMEHEIGKNIPVIMMSSQDSVSTVYKCMLRGAADYLVKPIRKNELRNLWQHVWRRQSSSSGVNGPQDESVAQQKVEATAENHATSNRSSGYDACIQRNKELIEKGSDAQSSFTKPVLEAESVPDVQEFSQLKCGESYPNETKMQEAEACGQMGQKSIIHASHAKGLTEGICKNGVRRTTSDKNGDPEHRGSASTSGEAHDNHYVPSSSAREAIDLIGAFLNHPNYSHKSSSVDYTGYSPHLDLSLRGSHASDLENEATEERHTLMHSNASAFKRYTNRQLIDPPATFINFCNQRSEQRRDGEKNISDIVTGGNSDGSTPSTQRGVVSPSTAKSKDSELATSHSQQGPSLPIAVKGIRFNDLHTAYGSTVPPLFCTQSSPQPMPSPSSAAHMEPTFQANGFYQSNIKENTPDQQYKPRGLNENNETNHILYMQKQNSEHVEDRGYISPTTDQSVCNSLCNGNVSQLYSIGYGSNCGSNSNVDQAGLVRTTSDAKNEDLTNHGSSHRSVQREAALNKFRLKRKERCYEKKVRYESRKKLAEQRPRVKGQFVRQTPQAPDKDG